MTCSYPRTGIYTHGVWKHAVCRTGSSLVVFGRNSCCDLEVKFLLPSADLSFAIKVFQLIARDLLRSQRTVSPISVAFCRA